MPNWFQRTFLGANVTTGVVTGQLVPESPWSDSLIGHVAFHEWYDGADAPVDRTAAMRVAPVKRGRAIIVGKCADLPLVAGRFDGTAFQPTASQPKWLTGTGTIVTPWHRMAHTLDDLIFQGWSLWMVTRGAAGQITDALRIPPFRWSFAPETTLGIRIDGEEWLDATTVVLFQGPDEGLLETGADVIRGARAMEAAWVGRVQNPIPLTVLHEVERNGVEDDEAQTLVDTYAAARRAPGGAVAFLPAQLNLETYGEVAADLFIGGRNAVRLDVANLLNLPASVLDGSQAGASLTYVTQEGDRQELIDWLEYYLAPIEARLSMDDVTPRGQVIRFDRSSLTASPNSSHGPALADQEDDDAQQLDVVPDTKELTAA
jgi:hypothetical protein